MRRVKYFIASSLDGYIARSDDGVDWILMDQDYGMSAFFKSVDAAVMGRGTYEKMLQLSPKQAFFPGMENYVFSMKSSKSKNVTIVSGDVGDWTRAIQSKSGKDIWLVGGADLVWQFLQAGLVDEIGLTIHPRLLGAGIELFPKPYPEMELELLGCQEYSTGLVQLSYGVKRDAAGKD